MSLVLLASAKDNYHAAFTLAEVDEGIGNKPVFVCDKEDGKSLSASEGPVRLVVPSDERPARWVRMLTSLEDPISPTVEEFAFSDCVLAACSRM